MGPETFLKCKNLFGVTVLQFCGSSARRLCGGINGDLLQEGWCHRLCMRPGSAALRTHGRVAGHCWPEPPQGTLTHSKAGGPLRLGAPVYLPCRLATCWHWLLIPLMMTNHHHDREHHMGLAWWLRGEESACQCRRHWALSLEPRVRKIPWRRKWQPMPRRNSWTEDPGGLQSKESQRVWDSNWACILPCRLPPSCWIAVEITHVPGCPDDGAEHI